MYEHPIPSGMGVLSAKGRYRSAASDALIYLSHVAASGGAGRDRTDDLKLAKLPLSQLSYGPVSRTECPLNPISKAMVGLGRLELPTSRLSSARSNQLSYRPIKLKTKTKHITTTRLAYT